MRDEWAADELVSAWTLVEEDWRLIANKSGATRLGFALLLKGFEADGRFPRRPQEFSEQVVAYVSRQVRVDAELFGAEACLT